LGYSFDKDFETIVLIAAAVGAMGGLIWDVANPVRRFSKEPPVGLDNRLAFPRLFRAGQTRGVDLGMLGPLIIGAGAGILVVLLGGRSGPDGDDVVRELANLAAATGKDAATTEEAATTAEQALGSQIDKPALYVLAFLGGIAGWALLQALASRLSSLFQVVVQQSAQAASQAAAAAVKSEGEKRNMNVDDTEHLASAAREAVTTTAEAVTQPQGTP
jgi:hypothetical protein